MTSPSVFYDDLKTGLYVALMASAFLFSSCKKDQASGPACAFDNNFTCAQTPPSKSTCGSYYERYFYDSETRSCQLVRYSGCTVLGFASRASCDSCSCRNVK